MKILLINGPAGSGKDFLSNYVASRLSGLSVKEKFAKPLKEACTILAGYSIFDLYHQGQTVWNWDNIREEKEKPRQELGGISWRQFNINVSEDLKKKSGQGYFGISLVNRLKNSEHPLFEQPKNVLISDSGFTEEAEEVVKHFGKNNVTVAKIVAFKDGKQLTFEGDSRGYIDYEYLGIKCVDLRNDFTEDFLETSFELLKDSFDLNI